MVYGKLGVELLPLIACGCYPVVQAGLCMSKCFTPTELITVWWLAKRLTSVLVSVVNLFTIDLRVCV